jgi:hypothetical protein
LIPVPAPDCTLWIARAADFAGPPLDRVPPGATTRGVGVREAAAGAIACAARSRESDNTRSISLGRNICGGGRRIPRVVRMSRLTIA